MANSSKIKIPISHYTYGSYKLHLVKTYSDNQILCGQKYTTINFIFNDITKYHPYNRVCKDCLKKLPKKIQDKINFDYIVYKLKDKK